MTSTKNKTPKNKCWIVGFCNDSFNYEPSLELISRVKKHNLKNREEKFKMYRKESTVQAICDKLNSI